MTHNPNNTADSSAGQATLSEAKISRFRHSFNSKPIDTITITQALEAIRTGAYQRQVAQVRDILTKQGKDAYDLAKAKLPALTFAGLFAPSRAIVNLQHHSGIVHGDLDHLSDVSAVKEKLCLDPRTAYVFVSPSANGLKLGVHIHLVDNDSDYKHAWQIISTEYESLYGGQWDKSGKDISRLCFVSYDPDLYWNPDATIFHVPSKAKISADHAVQTAVQMIQFAELGTRHHTRLRAAKLLGGYVGGGLLTEDEAYGALASALVGHTENLERALKTVQDGLDHGKAYPITTEALEAERLAWLQASRNGQSHHSADLLTDFPPDDEPHTGSNGANPHTSTRTKPASRPVIQSADEIAEEPMSWLWEPYLPMNMLVMLDGDPGLGKSLMLLQVATNLSRGQPFLDQFGKPTLAAHVNGPQTTLMLSAEDSLEYIMIPRLKRAGADLTRIKFLTGWLSADGAEHAFDLQHLSMLTQAIEQVKPVLVVLDPLVAYLGDIDMHRSNHTRPLMAALKRVAERYDCTIMGVRHPSKLDQGGPLMYRGQGNIDIVGAARSALWVQKHPTHPETQTLMIHSKTNVGAHGRTVIFSRERGEFSWVGVSRLTESMLTGKGPDPYAFLDAFFWLEETLKPGIEYPSADIEKQAEAREISHKVLSRAKRYLGITSKQVVTRWYMTLPTL